MFPFRGYLFWSWRLTHRGRGRIFAVFLASDVEKITIFWCKTKFQKKWLFWGIFPDVFFIMFPFSWLCFYTVLSGWSTTSGWAAEKASFSRTPKKCHLTFFWRPKKWRFFAWDNIRRFLAPALSLRRRIPYLSANRLEPRISRDQHIQTCQFKTTNVTIHPAVPKVLKCTLISSPLVRRKWPTQV